MVEQDKKLMRHMWANIVILIVAVFAILLLTQQENFKHFDEIAALYDTAKANVEANEKAEAEEEAKRLEEEKAELARRKAEKAAKKRK